MMEKAGVTSLVGEVVAIDKAAKSAKLADGEIIEYEKLVLATGSTPVIPKWLKGGDKKNVYTVPKDRIYLDEMKEKLAGCRRVVVIGAGFIGVEFSDEFAKHGHEVVLVEKLSHILALAFDPELSEKIETLLKDRGVNVRTGTGVTEIIGEDTVRGVKLENGEVIDADAVVLSMGYLPNSGLAKDMRKLLNKHYLMTVLGELIRETRLKVHPAPIQPHGGIRRASPSSRQDKSCLRNRIHVSLSPPLSHFGDLGVDPVQVPSFSYDFTVSQLCTPGRLVIATTSPTSEVTPAFSIMLSTGMIFTGIVGPVRRCTECHTVPSRPSAS